MRLLHGFENDVNKVAETIKWIIEQRKKYGWNKVRKEMEAVDVKKDDGLRLTNNVTRCSSEHILRYLDQENNDMDARLRFVPVIIGLTKKDTKYARKDTPYIYNPYCIFDTPKYCEEIKDKEICIRSKLVRKIMTSCELHSLSLKQNRIVRQMLIMDCTDLSFAKLMALFRCKPWKNYNDEIDAALNPTLVESVGKIIVFNMPWYAKTVYHILRATLPKRSLSKITLISGDEGQLLDFVDQETLETLMNHRKQRFDEDNTASLTADNVIIPSGKSIEIPITVSPGDNIEWEFTVKSNNVDFSIVYYIPSIDGDMEEQVVLEPQRCDPTDETVEGNYEVEEISSEGKMDGDDDTKKSMIVLKFSNARSWMKKSKLDYSINIEREDDDDDDSEGK